MRLLACPFSGNISKVHTIQPGYLCGLDHCDCAPRLLDDRGSKLKVLESSDYALQFLLCTGSSLSLPDACGLLETRVNGKQGKHSSQRFDSGVRESEQPLSPGFLVHLGLSLSWLILLASQLWLLGDPQLSPSSKVRGFTTGYSMPLADVAERNLVGEHCSLPLKTSWDGTGKCCKVSLKV